MRSGSVGAGAVRQRSAGGISGWVRGEVRDCWGNRQDGPGSAGTDSRTSVSKRHRLQKSAGLRVAKGQQGSVGSAAARTAVSRFSQGSEGSRGGRNNADHNPIHCENTCFVYRKVLRAQSH